MVSVASQRGTTAFQPEEDARSIVHRPVIDLIGWFAVFGCAFLNLANVYVDKDVVGLDPQVLAKLGILGLGGIYGLHGVLTREKARRVLLSFPVAWLLIIGACYFVSACFSSTPRNALVSSCSIVAVILMMVTALDHLGVKNTVWAIFSGMALFIVGSWFTYFALPEIGVLVEPTMDGKFVNRMSGLAHANTLGQYAGLTVVLCVILYFSYRHQNLAILAIGLLALAALFNSYSRTSIVACAAALLVGYRHTFLKREFLVGYVFASCAAIFGLLIVATQVDLADVVGSRLQLLSKSGDASEFATATGRSDIWAYAIELIQKRPLLGYGASTQKYFLAEYSSYTHNMILNIAFSAGIFAGIAAILMILGRIGALFVNRHPLSDAIVVFIIVNGLFENVIFSILAGLPTMLWVLALAWPLFRDDPAVAKLERSDRPIVEEHSKFLRLET